MGFFNFRGDNKNDNNTNTTTNDSNNLDSSMRSAGASGILVSDAANFIQANTTTDAGLVKSATDAFMQSAKTVQDTIASNNTAVNASLAIADGMTDKVFGLARDAGGGAFQLARDAGGAVLSFSRDTNQDTAALAAETMKRMNEATNAGIAAAASASRDALASNKSVQDSAFAFGAQAQDNVAKTAFEAIGMAGHITDYASQVATAYGKTSADLAATAVSQVKSAWSDASQAQANKSGGDYRMLMWALAAVVGLVAIKFGRGS